SLASKNGLLHDKGMSIYRSPKERLKDLLISPTPNSPANNGEREVPIGWVLMSNFGAKGALYPMHRTKSEKALKKLGKNKFES
ncbi:hypothetical protein PIB30_043682, partial [Stylosanthes scabra]|nr:hypothetical protein [Stylosanthes scabra]